MSEDGLEINYQSVYFAEMNSAVVALNIIGFGVKEFRRTYIFENLDKYGELSNKVKEKKSPTSEDIELSLGFVANHLIDWA